MTDLSFTDSELAEYFSLQAKAENYLNTLIRLKRVEQFHSAILRCFGDKKPFICGTCNVECESIEAWYQHIEKHKERRKNE